uniref:Platelet glycoprotein 4 n=1 Tax=Petromyzon marinus TaxID=7757 RepID=S4RBS0_PETMA
MGCCCSPKCCLVSGLVVAALLLVLGGVLIPIGDHIISSTVTKEAVLINGTVAFDAWVQSPSDVYRQFWFFNVTNSEEFSLQSNSSVTVKPKLKQLGPYTYKVRHLAKDKLVYHPNDSVSYVLPQQAIFLRDMSVGPEEDLITSINMVASALPVIMGFPGVLNSFYKKTNTSIFHTRTVRELLWGYKDPILESVASTGIDSTFGLFYPYNGSNDGVYTIFTGQGDISRVAIIHEWKYNKSMNFWPDEFCDRIKGTDGSSFPPFLNKKNKLEFFSSDVCRNLVAEFDQRRKLKGIDVYRYLLPTSLLSASNKNTANQCYTEYLNRTGCTRDGVLDISSCKGGAPVFISLPHFLDGSREYIDDVEGLEPNREDHETYLDVEPTTGITLSVTKRIQINVLLQPVKQIDIFKNVPQDYIFPIIWLNETGTLGDDSAKAFREALTIPMHALFSVQITLMALGSIGIVVSPIVYFSVKSYCAN